MKSHTTIFIMLVETKFCNNKHWCDFFRIMVIQFSLTKEAPPVTLDRLLAIVVIIDGQITALHQAARNNDDRCHGKRRQLLGGSCYEIDLYVKYKGLLSTHCWTYWSGNRTADILQATFVDVLSGKDMFSFGFELLRNLFEVFSWQFWIYRMGWNLF